MTKKTTNTDDVIAVLLDGKHVRYPVAFNASEGWVEMQIPVKLENSTTVESGQDLTLEEDEETAEFHWQTVRKQGTVELVYDEDVKC